MRTCFVVDPKHEIPCCIGGTTITPFTLHQPCPSQVHTPSYRKKRPLNKHLGESSLPGRGSLPPASTSGSRPHIVSAVEHPRLPSWKTSAPIGRTSAVKFQYPAQSQLPKSLIPPVAKPTQPAKIDIGDCLHRSNFLNHI
jgi:hypothetical protein